MRWNWYKQDRKYCEYRQDGQQSDQPTKHRLQRLNHGNDTHSRWSNRSRLAVSVPIFIVLMALFAGVSQATVVPNGSQTVDKAIRTLQADTSVTFDENTIPVDRQALYTTYDRQIPKIGRYTVQTQRRTLQFTQQSTGYQQQATVLITMPDIDETQAASHILPAVVFMHGAGSGMADDSFADLAYDLASAGVVALRVDKPMWHTTHVNRDYAASAQAYEQVVQLARTLPQVDPHNVGLYATSESTWIAPMMLQQDSQIAFQIVSSPMVFSPRHALAFLVAEDMAIIGANDGYKAFGDRLFSGDMSIFGLYNLDIPVDLPKAYGIPTYVAYGDKDVMTAQVDGIARIEALAHRDRNWDVTVRNYSMGNHVIRLGDASVQGTPYADFYERDLVQWTLGKALQAKQTSASVAGATIRQSVTVPTSLHAHKALTIYGAVLHIFAILMLVVSAVLTIALLIRRMVKFVQHQSASLGFVHGFRAVLMYSSIAALGSLLLFIAAVGQIVLRIVNVIWGAAPVAPHMIYWSWYVMQGVAVLVVWAWARVFARIIEAAVLNRHSQTIQPLIASTKLGHIVFAAVGIATLTQLLVLAYWGLYIYW